jgi:peptide chain release factor subunit 1
MPQTQVLNQDRIAKLIAMPRGEDPVISLYLKSWGANTKATLKNLIREGEAAIEADTGWDPERKKEARGLLEGLRGQAEALLQGAPTKGRGSHALFARSGGGEQLTLPVDLRERIVVDRSPYASPLSSLIDQYERYGVIICGQKKATLFEVYLGEIEGWEQVEGEHQRHRRAPAGGPQRSATKGAGSFQGLEELRRRNHAEYVLHQHLAEVADRAFRRFRVRPFDRLIIGGNKEVMPKLEEHLHSYLKQRVVAREQLSLDLSQKDAREKILAIEARVEEEKELELLAKIRDRVGSAGLGTTGLDETLRSLFYGKVDTLVVLDDVAIPGRECPECNFLFERPEDEKEKTPTLVECPICKRSTRRVPDIIDEAVELAIMSGARVEHVAYAKAQLRQMGWVAAILRFK